MILDRPRQMVFQIDDTTAHVLQAAAGESCTSTKDKRQATYSTTVLPHRWLSQWLAFGSLAVLGTSFHSMQRWSKVMILQRCVYHIGPCHQR
jgi:hypothetical protein